MLNMELMEGECQDLLVVFQFKPNNEALTRKLNRLEKMGKTFCG